MVREIMDYISSCDEAVGKALYAEYHRQQRNLELIASENIVSPAVMLAMGTVPTNKYAEGYPEKRYYGGCEEVDVLEDLAIERAKKLFGAEHACVQPHSGASANLAVYQAFLEPGDTVMGMNLAHGGHLTHGSPVNISGRLYHFVPYNVNADGVLDYEEIRRLALEHQPKMIVAGASAYPRKSGLICLQRLQRKSELIFSWIWHISQGLLRQDFIRIRYSTQMWYRRRHIKHCEDHVAV